MMGIPAMAAAAGATPACACSPHRHRPAVPSGAAGQAGVHPGPNLRRAAGFRHRNQRPARHTGRVRRFGDSGQHPGRRTDEMLRVMKQLWTIDNVSHHGRFFNFDGVTLLPKPCQQPYPPIWVAGRSDAAIRRAAIAGDGWYPYLFTVNRIRRSNASVRELAEQSGRELGRFHWGLNQPTAIDDNPDKALATAVAHVGPALRYPRTQRRGHRPRPVHNRNAEDCIGSIRERIDAGVRDFVFGFLAGEPMITSGRWICSQPAFCHISNDDRSPGWLRGYNDGKHENGDVVPVGANGFRRAGGNAHLAGVVLHHTALHAGNRAGVEVPAHAFGSLPVGIGAASLHHSRQYRHHHYGRFRPDAVSTRTPPQRQDDGTHQNGN